VLGEDEVRFLFGAHVYIFVLFWGGGRSLGFPGPRTCGRGVEWIAPCFPDNRPGPTCTNLYHFLEKFPRPLPGRSPRPAAYPPAPGTPCLRPENSISERPGHAPHNSLWQTSDRNGRRFAPCKSSRDLRGYKGHEQAGARDFL
jgi:hypothetical protein